MKLKKQLVENDCNGLIEFIESSRISTIYTDRKRSRPGCGRTSRCGSKVISWRMPKGYLLCGPVGTGKTFMVECLAGEARVPVVKFKNFRDKWVGSTEGNLDESSVCFRHSDVATYLLMRPIRPSGVATLPAATRASADAFIPCSLKRWGAAPAAGKLIWILASSRPDLIEVDLSGQGELT